MTLVDSHCHLDDRQFDHDRAAVITRALEAGVTGMLAIGTGDGPPDLEAAIRLADAFPQVYATVGVHPHDAGKATPETWRKMRELLSHPKVLAVGEIGLDYYYGNSPREAQRAVFLEQLRLAAEARKPIVIHTREAWAETVGLLQTYWAATGLSGVFHCFSGGPEEAAQALNLGFFLGFGGVLTFPKAERVRAAARSVPLDRLLLETDAPYLAPVPHRGKRNEPAFVLHTARALAAARQEPLETLARATTQNFQRLCLPAAGASQ